ncbi:MAG: BamA/TamA family outer membrane protein, partial [Chlorobiaceae bacterium]|nr:BamA/TamA family outer membrane protein [Chlorobiaceae bacterium]
MTAEHLHAQVAGTTGITSSFGFEPDYSSDYGPVLGGGVTLEQSGVGNDPYRCAMKFRGGAAPFVEFRYRLQYRGDFRVLLQNTSLLVEASTSGLEVMDFFGFGNESYYSGSGYSEDYFELKSQITKIGATLCYPMQSDYYWSAGIRAKWVDLDITPGSYADQHRAEIPGIDNSFSGSLRIGFCYDTRQTSLSPGLSPDLKKTRFSHETAGSNTAVSGMVLNVEAALYPEFFGNERAFTKLSAEIRSYIPVSRDGNSRAVLRIGTEKLWGNFPFWEAAYLGGSTSLRGYERQRFAGDA